MGDRAAGPCDDDSGSCKEKENAATVQPSREKQDVMPPPTFTHTRGSPDSAQGCGAGFCSPQSSSVVGDKQPKEIGLDLQGRFKRSGKETGTWRVSEVATGAGCVCMSGDR